MNGVVIGVRLGAVLLSALVLQASVLSELRVADVSIDLLLALAIAAGLTGGPDRGAVVGFVAGLLTDLLVQTPFGLAALSYAATGYVAGLLNEAVVRSARLLSVLIAIGAGAFGVAVPCSWWPGSSSARSCWPHRVCGRSCSWSRSAAACSSCRAAG
jgi:rod shape-determining protein MreD